MNVTALFLVPSGGSLMPELNFNVNVAVVHLRGKSSGTLPQLSLSARSLTFTRTYGPWFLWDLLSYARGMNRLN